MSKSIFKYKTVYVLLASLCCLWIYFTYSDGPLIRSIASDYRWNTSTDINISDTVYRYIPIGSDVERALTILDTNDIEYILHSNNPRTYIGVIDLHIFPCPFERKIGMKIHVEEGVVDRIEASLFTQSL